MVAVVENALAADRNILDLQRSGVCVLTRPLPSTYWRRFRRKLSRGRTHVSLDLEKLLPDVIPALTVLSTGACLMPIEFLETCVSKGWPFVTIGQANDVGWWPDDETARRYREALRNAIRCYFVSSANWRLSEKHLGDKIDNGEVVRNPFNVSYDAAPAWPRMGDDSELRLACVARLHPPSKGQDVLLEALAHPDWAARRWRLTFYGDWPWRDGLQRLVGNLGLGERIAFAGHVANVEKIWAENHALVMPSRFEGLPIAMVEAMLCARPVVTTDVAGHREIVEEGVSGFIADTPTVPSVRAALERLWARRDDLDHMGKMAARSIREKIPRDPVGVFSRKIREIAMRSSRDVLERDR